MAWLPFGQMTLLSNRSGRYLAINPEGNPEEIGRPVGSCLTRSRPAWRASCGLESRENHTASSTSETGSSGFQR